jgi:hypothetical protein
MPDAKKYITVKFEVDYWIDEVYSDDGFEYPEVIDGVTPVSLETENVSTKNLRSIDAFLEYSPNGSYDLIWDLRATLQNLADELDT